MCLPANMPVVFPLTFFIDNVAAYHIIQLIRLYQKVLFPLKGGMI